MNVCIRTWTEPFPSHEGVAVVFDVFRCSTTIHTLFHRAAGPVFVAPTLKDVSEEPRLREMRVFSELSQPVECLQRYDNSPHEALTGGWKGDSLVATTTGTPAMFTAKGFRRVYVGSLVNFSSLVAALADLQEPVTLIPAAYSEWNHVEDEITAQAVATALGGFTNIPDFVRQCAEQARERIIASSRPADLERKLPTGLEDVRLSLDIDRYRHLCWLEFDSAPFASVRGNRP